MKYNDNKTKRALVVYISIFFLLAMGIVISGYVSYHNFEQEFRRQAEHQISAIAELKVNGLVNWRNERFSDADFLSHNKAFSESVERYFESPQDVEARIQLLAWLDHYRAYNQYDKVRLLDVTGAESLSIPTAPDSFDSHLTQDAIACLRSGKVTFWDFRRDAGMGTNIHLFILVPIFAGQTNSHPLGVLVLSIDPETYLYPYISQWPIPSNTAETLLVRRDGEDVLFLNELRFGQDAPLTLRFPLVETDLPAVKAALGQTGVVQGVDYRGEPVLADVRAVPDSPWFLVSKMDTAEVYAPLRARLWQTFGMIGLAIFASGTGLALAWRQQRILFYRTQAEAVESLRESEEKYRRLFDNAVLGIFQSTPEGKAISVNNAFASMFGYDSPEDAIKSIKNVATDIFADPNRRAEIMRLLAENPNLRTFENLYRRKDGSTFFGSLNTMPIRDSNGSLIRMEGIIEDITQRKQAEEALDVEQYLMNTLMDNVPVRIYFKDCESRFIRINDTQSQSFGLNDAGQAVGKTDFDFFSDEHAQQAYEDEQEIIRTGQPISKEEKETRDGLPDKWVSTSKLPLRDKDKKIIGTFGLSVDITERKQAEDALSLRETYLTAIIENQPGLVWLKDMEGRFLVVNSAFALSCGKQAPEDLSGKTDLDIWPRELAEKYKADDAEVIKQKTPLHVEESIFDQGQAKWFETFKIPIIEETGQVIGTTGFARDITERKQVEDALRESEEKYRRLYDHAPLGIFQSTLEGESISINPAFARMHGYESPEDVLKNIKNIATDVFADPNRRAEIMHLMKENPDLKTFENVYRRKDGSTFIGNLNMMLIRNPDGRVVRVEGIVEDITERKQAEQEIRQLNAELEQRVRERTVQLEATNKELEAFSYSVSHDLRAPLRGIDGWSQALFEDYHDQFDEQGRQYIERVRSETQRMGRLIDDMLKLSRLTRAEMIKEQVDLSALAQAIADRLQTAEPLRKVEFNIQAGLMAEGDSHLLEIVLTNLLENAFKFSGKRAEALIEFGQTESQGQHVFFMRDNGAGFDMAYAQKLFGAFQRMHKVSEFPGTGIGLATVQRIIHRHGGRVWAEAEVESGTTFYFTLKEVT